MRKIIKEELRHLLLEFDPVDDDDPEHDEGSDEPDADWDKVVADRDAEMRRNPPELGMKGARKRRAAYEKRSRPSHRRTNFETWGL